MNTTDKSWSFRACRLHRKALFVRTFKHKAKRSTFFLIASIRKQFKGRYFDWFLSVWYHTAAARRQSTSHLKCLYANVISSVIAQFTAQVSLPALNKRLASWMSCPPQKQHLNPSWREEQFEELSLYLVFSVLSTHIGRRTQRLTLMRSFFSHSVGKSVVVFS